MSSRIYLDYNATTPVCKSFAKALAQGEIPFANPSSQHADGKKSHQYLEQVKLYLFEYFGLSPKEYDILFHSGATEAANTFLAPPNCEQLLYFVSDHPCVTNLSHPNKTVIQINSSGTFDSVEVVSEVLKRKSNKTWLHYTYLHNETGIKWDLEHALTFKQKTGALIYVDAVQAPGKIATQKLLSGIDVYTFSAHKFGGLKGVGFSFFSKQLKFSALIFGGGQQAGLRSGTLNVQGIASIKYALSECNYSQELLKFKQEIIELLKTNSQIIVIEGQANNTICFMHKEMKADILLIHFDMAQLDISTGSACSSGSLKASPTLEAMGHGELARHNIRISLGNENLLQKDVIMERLKSVLEKI